MRPLGATLARLLDPPRLRRRWIYRSVTAILVTVMMLAVLYPLLWSRWALIDDHQLIEFYDSSPSHGPSWFFRTVMDSETMHPGGGSRYRPIYYLFRIAESALLQGNARLWWWSHTAMFIGAIVLLVWSLRRLTGIWENLLAAAWLLASITWWGEVFCRLGPAEAYAVPAMALYGAGAIGAVSTLRWSHLRRYHAWCAAALAIGGVIAAGSKENMAFLAMPSAYIAWRARFVGSRRRVTIACIVHIAFTTFVFVAAYLGVRGHGHVYLEDTSTSGRLDATFAAIKVALPSILRWAIPVIVMMVAAIVVARRRERAQMRALTRVVVTAATVIGFIAIAWVSQLLFYGTWPPKEPRYLFPAGLAAPLAIYVCYWAAIRGARALDIAPGTIAFFRVAAILVLAVVVLRGRFPVKESAIATHKKTLHFYGKLKRISDEARKHPDVPVIFVSNGLIYEPVHAVQLFLRHYGVRNKFYLKLEGVTSSQYPAGSLGRELATAMETVARVGGGKTGGFSQTSPYAYVGGPCIGVGFSGDTGLEACPAIVTFDTY